MNNLRRNLKQFSSIITPSNRLCFSIIKQYSKVPMAGHPLLHGSTYNFASNSFGNPDKTVNLPFLADSINEGTVAEFTKRIPKIIG